MTTVAQQKIAAILCRRDGCTFAEAEELIQMTIEEIEETAYDAEATIDIMMNNLGLETDYILDLLY